MRDILRSILLDESINIVGESVRRDWWYSNGCYNRRCCSWRYGGTSYNKLRAIQEGVFEGVQENPICLHSD